jgi:hypothetical protein
MLTAGVPTASALKLIYVQRVNKTAVTQSSISMLSLTVGIEMSNIGASMSHGNHAVQIAKFSEFASAKNNRTTVRRPKVSSLISVAL